MYGFECLNEAFANVAVACGEFAAAFAEAVGAICAQLPLDEIRIAAAYAAAQTEHAEWVHRATYSKRKRIRKKYHDRIMREYWEG